MQFPLEDFVSKTVACEKITVNYRHNELDALFAGLRTNKTVKKLKVAMVMNLPYSPSKSTKTVYQVGQNNEKFMNLETCLKENTTLTSIAFSVCHILHP